MLNRLVTPTESLPTEDYCPTLGANCHKGVVFQTIKSVVHTQGASLQTTKKTSSEAFLNSFI